MSANHHDLPGLWLGKPAVTKRELILAAAQQTLSVSGFHQTEVQVISNRTGISKATIYKIFRSKDNLLLEMVKEVFDHLSVMAMHEIIGDGAPVDRLRRIAEAFLLFGEQNRDLCLLILRDGARCVAGISHAYKESLQRMLGAIEPLFRAARETGELGPVPTEVIVETVLVTLLGHFQAWFILHNCEGDLREQGMRTVEYLISEFSRADGPQLHQG